MTGFNYHGHAVGMNGSIHKPVQHVVDNHGHSGADNLTPGTPYSGTHASHEVAGVLSYERCDTSVAAMPEKDGYFRTEVRSTMLNLQVMGDVSLSAARIVTGMVSVYRRQWYGQPGPQAYRARVLPLDCLFENVKMNGIPIAPPMPAPFTYSPLKRETYLSSDNPDPAIDAEVRATIGNNASRCYYIPNFGRIFFCEWTVVPGDTWHLVHQISMVRLAMGSPTVADLVVPSAMVNGHPIPPPP
jgi:hypothetical protein